MSETLGSTAFYLALLKGNNQQWKWDRGLKADCSNLFKMFFLGKINTYDFVSMMRKHFKTMADYTRG